MCYTEKQLLKNKLIKSIEITIKAAEVSILPNSEGKWKLRTFLH